MNTVITLEANQLCGCCEGLISPGPFNAHGKAHESVCQRVHLGNERVAFTSVTLASHE